MPHFLLPLAESGTQNIRASSSQALALKLTGTASSPGSPACRWKPIPHGRSVCSSVHPSTYLSVLFLLRTLIQCLHVCRGVLTCIYCDPHPHPRIVHTLLSHGPSKSAPLAALSAPGAQGCSRDGLGSLQYTEPFLCPEQWLWGPGSLSTEAFPTAGGHRRSRDLPTALLHPCRRLGPHRLLPTSGVLPRPRAMQPSLIRNLMVLSSFS